MKHQEGTFQGLYARGERAPRDTVRRRHIRSGNWAHQGAPREGGAGRHPVLGDHMRTQLGALR